MKNKQEKTERISADLSEVKNGNLELAGTVLEHTETKIYIYFVYKQSSGSR